MANTLAERVADMPMLPLDCRLIPSAYFQHYTFFVEDAMTR